MAALPFLPKASHARKTKAQSCRRKKTNAIKAKMRLRKKRLKMKNKKNSLLIGQPTNRYRGLFLTAPVTIKEVAWGF